MIEGLPRHVLFDCREDGLHIIDTKEARASILQGTPESWMTFLKGPKNIIESTPQKIVHRNGDVIGVQCQDGSIVYIDFAEGNAKKHSGEKVWVYMGGIDRGNDGLGYIPSS